MKKVFYIPILSLLLLSCSLDKDEQATISTELSKLSEQLNPTQTFEMNPEKDTLLVGRNGTNIFISANSLVFENGEQPTNTVLISLKEVYSISEMIANGLSTTTNGELLESSGMIKLEASSNNRPLQLRLNSPIRIQFKKMTSAPFMRTYLGAVDSTGINWELDKNNIYDTVKFEETTEYIMPKNYGGDTIVSEYVTYGIVGNDTIELQRTPITEVDISSDTTYQYEAPFYEIHSTQLNWINCDFFINSDDNIRVMVNRFEEAKTQIYLVFNDYYSFMSSWESEGNNLVFRNIPRKSKVTVIGIAKKGSDYFLAMYDLMLKEENQQIRLDYKKSSIEEISNKLKELDKNLK